MRPRALLFPALALAVAAALALWWRGEDGGSRADSPLLAPGGSAPAPSEPAPAEPPEEAPAPQVAPHPEAIASALPEARGAPAEPGVEPETAPADGPVMGEIPADEPWYGRVVPRGLDGELRFRVAASWRAPGGGVREARVTATPDGRFELRAPGGRGFELLVTHDPTVAGDRRWGSVAAPFVPRLVRAEQRSPDPAAPTPIVVEACGQLTLRVELAGRELRPPPQVHAQVELPEELLGDVPPAARDLSWLREMLARRPLAQVGPETWAIGGLAPGCPVQLRLGGGSGRLDEPSGVALGDPVVLLPGEWMELTRRVEPVPLAGRWRDQHGAPIADHAVRVVEDIGWPGARTDADGRFELPYVAPGPCELELFAPDPNRSEVAARRVRVEVPPLDERAPLELTTDRGLYLRGRMLTRNGLAASAGRVSARAINGGASRTATCDAAGRFAFGPLLAGEYELQGIDMDPAAEEGGVHPITPAVRAAAGGEPVELRCE